MTEKHAEGNVDLGKNPKQTSKEVASEERVESLSEEFRITKGEVAALGDTFGSESQWEEVVGRVLRLAHEGQERVTMGIYLAALGSVVLLLTLFWKLRPFGIQVSDLETPEFITAFLVGTLLVIFGGFLQTYSYKAKLDQRKDAVETSESLIRDITHARADLTRNYVDAKYKAVANFRPPGRPTLPDVPPNQRAAELGSKIQP